MSDRVPTISVEIAHLSAEDLTSEHVVSAAMETASSWLKHLDPNVLDRISVTVLLDDYYEEVDLPSATKTLLKAAENANVSINYVVSEAAIAESVDLLDHHLFPVPAMGSGSSSDVGDSLHRFLSSVGEYVDTAASSPHPRPAGGAIRRFSDLEPSGDKSAHEPGSQPNSASYRGMHKLDLVVELWSPSTGGGRLWSCAMLAAWWQLVRLGCLKKSRPEAAAHGITVIDQSRPFECRNTLSILNSRYLEIEHAVRSILRCVQMPPEWVDLFRIGADVPSERAHLSAIQYVFSPAA